MPYGCFGRHFAAGDMGKVHEPSRKLRLNGCVCRGCERTFHADLIVADSIWEQIAPSPQGTHRLCPTCIIERLVSKGLWRAQRAYNIDSVVELIIE